MCQSRCYYGIIPLMSGILANFALAQAVCRPTLIQSYLIIHNQEYISHKICNIACSIEGDSPAVSNGINYCASAFSSRHND